MPRTKLDTGLLDLRMQVMQVGLQVEDSLAKTLKAVETGNYTSLPWIIETNDTIGTLCTAIERQALRLLILQQPLGGQDLRLLTASLHISADFSLIGNAIVEVAQTLPRSATLFSEVAGQINYSVHVSPVDQQGLLTDSLIFCVDYLSLVERFSIFFGKLLNRLINGML